MKSEQKYYENDYFWNPQNITDVEKKRIIDTYKLLPKDIKSIADIGCGNGIFANYVKQKNKKIKIIGMDNSENALKYVETNKIKGDINKIPLNTNEYDIAVALEVIEHLSLGEFEKSLKELARISKKYILISVPNNEKLKNNFIECPNCYSQFSASFHKKSFNKKIMENLFIKNNFKCKNIKYIGPRKNYLIISPLYCFINKFIQKKYSKKPFICPVCNFNNSNNKIKKKYSPKNKIIRSRLVFLLNQFWPTQTKYKWIIGLYKKID